MSQQTWKMSVDFIAVVALVLVVGMAAAAQAVTISYINATVACSSTDLLQTNLSSSSSTGSFSNSGYLPAGSSPALMYDGTALYDTTAHGTPSYEANRTTLSLAVNSDQSMTFTLDTSVNTLGYALSAINVFHGWTDSGRARSDFSAFFSTVGAPTTFTPIYSDAQYLPPSNYGEDSIAIGAGAVTGVKSVRINFGSQLNGFDGYSEIDVVGTPVPEPATMALLGLGAVGMLIRRRRKA